MLNFILAVMLIFLLLFVYIAYGRNFVNVSSFMIAGFLLPSIISSVSLVVRVALVGWKTVFFILSGVNRPLPIKINNGERHVDFYGQQCVKDWRDQ